MRPRFYDRRNDDHDRHGHPYFGHLLAALSAAVCIAVLSGCGSGATTFEAAPETPTDLKEIATIEHVARTYDRTTRLIRADFAACAAKLPPGVPARSCRLDVEALSTQRLRQLRGPLSNLAGRLGPRCDPLISKVLDVDPAAAGPPLGAAAKACRAEYERENVRP